MFDIIIIGAGPGGMDTAIEAQKQEKEVLLIERDEIGGTCLNRGCIPTKALLHWASVADELRKNDTVQIFSLDDLKCRLNAVLDYKDRTVSSLREGAEQLLSKITIVRGDAEIKNGHTVSVDGSDYEAHTIIIATGSEPSVLPITGAEKAITSNELLTDRDVWSAIGSSMVIIGGGVIGIEIAAIIKSLMPTTEITVIEYCKEILPSFDREIAKRLRMLLTKKGIKFIIDAKVTAISDNLVRYERKGKEDAIDFTTVLMATGRKPVFPKGLETAGIEYSNKGIKVNDEFRTSIPSVYAIGDVNGLNMLAHAATAQGKKVLGEDVNTKVIPGVVFSNPECAMVGLTEEQCTSQNIDYKIKKAFFRANGKAVTMDETDGFVKLIIDKSTDKLLGAHILGPHASDLIAEAALIISNNLSVKDLSRSVHAHPTLNEILITALND